LDLASTSIQGLALRVKRKSTSRFACPGRRTRRLPQVRCGLYGQPEAAGLKAIAIGFGLIGLKDDHQIPDREFIVYDALYAYCQKEVASAGE